MQHNAHTQGRMNRCTEEQICLNSKEATEWSWILDNELMKGSILGMSSTNARSFEDEGIFECYVDVIKQRGQSFAIIDPSADGIFVIGERFQTNEIISIAAGEKIVSWWKSVQNLSKTTT